MNPRQETSPATQLPSGPGAAGDDAGTGLPLLRTWRGVYLVVFACFVVFVALLALLTAIFS
jgi:hypothetical protein